MNVRPKNYSWTEFYDHVVDTFDYAFSAKAIARRFWHNRRSYVTWEQLFRGVSSDRSNRMGYHMKMRRWMEDPSFRAFFEGKTTQVPPQMTDQVKRHLGPLWEWLPKGAMNHDPNAYLHSMPQALPVVA
jgi:hypothetical protein